MTNDCSFIRPVGPSTAALVFIVSWMIPPPSELNMFTRLSLDLNLFRRPPSRTFDPPLSLSPESVCHLCECRIMIARQDFHVVAQAHQKVYGLNPFQNPFNVLLLVYGAVRAIDDNHQLDEFIL